MPAEEFEDVLVIRVCRPAGSHAAETKTMTRDEAERRGMELAAMQTVFPETADRAFVEELCEAWDRVAEVAREVQQGKRNLGGEATDADR